MSAARSTGSPGLDRTPSLKKRLMDENTKVGKDDYSISTATDQLKSLLVFEQDNQASLKRPAGALATSSLANQSCPEVSPGQLTQLADLVQLIGLGQRTKLIHESRRPSDHPDHLQADHALSQAAQHSSSLPPIGSAVHYPADSANGCVNLEQAISSNSVPITPLTDSYGSTVPAIRPASAAMNESTASADEVSRLKYELAQAQNKISLLDQELASTRQVRPGLEQPASTSPVEGGFVMEGHNVSMPPRGTGVLHGTPSAPFMSREGGHSWPGYDDSRSDTSDAVSTAGFNRGRNIWGNMKPTPGVIPPPEIPQSGPWMGRAASHSYVESGASYDHSAAGNYRAGRLTPDFDLTTKPPGQRRGNRFDPRFSGQNYAGQGGYYGYSYQGHYEPGPLPTGGSQGGMGAALYPNYQPPGGTSLSPLASEFTSMTSPPGPWKSDPVSTEGQTYLPTTEPLNYRRLLDRNVNCNWKYIVDKIVCSNDQQASIFLQQKLKVGTPDQKYDIVEAIVAQAYPLMVNRFGNFLVQRCFEHGTPEQVIKIAQAIRGCTLTLSMDPFGCHVVQKAFDSVPEDYKAIMVHELLRRIPETVIHRYACHVWQKLFELRWTESPPQIMKYVNEALRGMWHEVALGETGSLVVQNIFENCLEEDKRPCIEEVLSNINIVAHGQFGNWCIQHICEHGAPADRSRAIDHVIRYAAKYSMDQYASKVVEKCLKIGGAEFLARYLDRVCEGRLDRPRIPLIDIASDQYGNYLIQWILQHANPQHKEIVAAHIRKHMVSLRGSKFGSRVGMLCTNPAVVTRPGPGVGPGVSRMPPGPRYGGGRAYQ
ncbi:ARM repeat-containing protein [Xylariaceae sp. FL0594]|nr:ARM repeat-containing protein [Xylariaceae sp. FL0594]